MSNHEPKVQALVAQALLKVQEKFAEYLGKGDVELQAFSTFLFIAARSSDFAMQELEEMLGLSQASVSRNVALLSIGSVKNPGPRLIEAFEDPEYRRRKHVRLTARGRKLAEEITAILATYCKKAGL
jgi:DNA-binding MarR family transcriptional regulator